MKRLIVVILLFFFASPAYAWMSLMQVAASAGGAAAAPMAYVQGTGVEASSGTITTPSITVTSGNLLVVGVLGYALTVTDGMIADSRGNTWQRDQLSEYSTTDLVLFSCIAKDSGALTVTVTPGSTKTVGITISEFTNPATSSWFSVGSAATAASTAPATGNMVFAEAGACVGVFGHVNTGTTIAEDAGWTKVYEQEAGTVIAHAMAYSLKTAGTHNVSWTLGASKTWLAAGGCYKQK